MFFTTHILDAAWVPFFVDRPLRVSRDEEREKAGVLSRVEEKPKGVRRYGLCNNEADA
jgi:hypothetical protein